jgi:hypothetical protein
MMPQISGCYKSYKHFTIEDHESIDNTRGFISQALSAVKSCRSLPAQKLVSTVLEHAIADCDKILKSDRGVK